MKMGVNRNKKESSREKRICFTAEISVLCSFCKGGQLMEKNPMDITGYRSGLVYLKETKYILCDLSKFLKYLG